VHIYETGNSAVANTFVTLNLIRMGQLFGSTFQESGALTIKYNSSRTPSSSRK